MEGYCTPTFQIKRIATAYLTTILLRPASIVCLIQCNFPIRSVIYSSQFGRQMYLAVTLVEGLERLSCRSSRTQVLFAKTKKDPSMNSEVCNRVMKNVTMMELQGGKFYMCTPTESFLVKHSPRGAFPIYELGSVDHLGRKAACD